MKIGLYIGCLALSAICVAAATYIVPRRSVAKNCEARLPLDLKKIDGLALDGKVSAGELKSAFPNQRFDIHIGCLVCGDGEYGGGTTKLVMASMGGQGCELEMEIDKNGSVREISSSYWAENGWFTPRKGKWQTVVRKW